MKNTKKWMAVLLCGLMLLVSAACSQEEKNPKASDVVDELRAEIEFPEMTSQSVENLAAYGYDLTADDVEDMCFILAGSGITADEVFVVKLKDESKADSVKKMMETRRDMVKDTAADYTPEETEKLTTAVIGSKGAYVYYAATNDNTKAKEILNNAF